MTKDQIELHLLADPMFTRKGWGKRVEAVRGTFSEVRGDATRRYVTLPNTAEAQALACDLLREFPLVRETVIIGRPYCGDAIIRRLPRGADPSVIFATIDGVCRGTAFRLAEKNYDESYARERARPGLLRKEREMLAARLAEIDRELSGGERAPGNPHVFWSLS